jgi:hypothetical protein
MATETTEIGTASAQPDFGHAPVRDSGPMGDATRYLCAAAYLDDRFRRKLLKELIYRTHRAPAPSYGGFDVAPVLMHCLRARRMMLVRDLAFVVLLIGGLWVSSIGVAFYVALAIPFAILSVIQPMLLRRRLKLST